MSVKNLIVECLWKTILGNAEKVLWGEKDHATTKTLFSIMLLLIPSISWPQEEGKGQSHWTNAKKTHEFAY